MVWGNAGRAVQASIEANPELDARRQSALTAEYPMHVVPFNEFMAMDHWTPHQHLKAQGKLRVFDESMRGRVFFVSHQWTSYNHPDKDCDQLQSLQHVLRRLAAGEMSVKGNFVVEFGYGLKQGHTSAEWKAMLPDSYLWVDYMCMPQPLASLPEDSSGDNPHAGQVSDHRQASDAAVTAEVSVLIEQLKAAVDSIPAYIENCTEMFVVVPSIKHADREGEVCDFSTWRSRGWCRMEFVSSRLACHGDIPVMVINSREKVPTYFNLCDTMKLFAGNGNFTVDDDKKKVKGVLTAMLQAKSAAEFDKGNVGLSRGHVLLASAFLAGLPKDEAHGAADGAAELAEVKEMLFYRDDETEAAWAAKTGCTLLHCCAALDKVGAVRALLATAEGKAMLNTRIKDLIALDPCKDPKSPHTIKNQGGMKNLVMSAKGMTPLQGAMMMVSTSPATIEALLDAGAEDKAGRAFMFGCINGSASNMATYHAKMALRNPKAPWLTKHFMEMMGATALHLVAGMADTVGQKEKADWLLAQTGGGASLRKTWMLGGSPMAALSMNSEADLALFDLFVRHGCDVNERIKPWALAKGMVRVIKLFKAFRPTKFSEADDMLQFMGGGGTPLHRAAMEGNLRNMRKLIEHGARNDGKDRFGQMPIGTLQKFHPDSQAPDILGSGIVPPSEKLRHAANAIKLASKLKVAKVGGGDRVLPNNPAGGEAAQAATPTAA